MTCLDYNLVANRSSRVTAAVLVALTAGCAVEPPAERPPIWTDGDFDDWEGVAALVVDPTGDVPAGSPWTWAPLPYRTTPASSIS